MHWNSRAAAYCKNGLKCSRYRYPQGWLKTVLEMAATWFRLAWTVWLTHARLLGMHVHPSHVTTDDGMTGIVCFLAPNGAAWLFVTRGKSPADFCCSRRQSAWSERVDMCRPLVPTRWSWSHFFCRDACRIFVFFVLSRRVKTDPINYYVYFLNMMLAPTF